MEGGQIVFRARFGNAVAISLLVLIVQLVALSDSSWAMPTTVTEFSAGLGGNSLPENPTLGPDGNIWFDTLGEGERAIGRITPAGSISLFTEGLDGGTPLGIVAGPDGNLWFDLFPYEDSSSAIGRITTSGEITLFKSLRANTSPDQLTVGPEGNIWFVSGWARPGIGWITSTGAVAQFDLPDRPRSIAPGSDGNMWFTYGENETAAIGEVAATEGGGTTITLRHVGLGSDSRPEAIVLGQDGNLWFIDNPEEAIGRVTLDGTITEFHVGGRSLRNIVASRDGSIWFGEWAGVGRISSQGEADTFTFPGLGDGRTVRRIAVGQEGDVWYTAEGQLGDGMVGRATSNGSFTEFSSGLNAGSQPVEIVSGRDATLWFTDHGSRPAIGRIVPGEDSPPVGPSSATTGLKTDSGPPGRLVLVRRVIHVESGIAKLVLRCIQGAHCSGRLSLTARAGAKNKFRALKRKVIGAARFSIRSGATEPVEIPLNGRGQALLRKSRWRLASSLTIFGATWNLAAGQRLSVRLKNDRR